MRKLKNKDRNLSFKQFNSYLKSRKKKEKKGDGRFFFLFICKLMLPSGIFFYNI